MLTTFCIALAIRNMEYTELQTLKQPTLRYRHGAGGTARGIISARFI